ncbi:hypothetical protein G5V59_05545 [Nocardioides sp. W3-2-3]|nr:hypothetical protein [Nocardioides convexus]
MVATDYLNIGLTLHLDGIEVGDLVGSTLKGLIGLLGLKPGTPAADLLEALGLGGLLSGLTGGRTTTTGTKSGITSGATSGTRSGSPGGTTTGGYDPLGLGPLLTGLLGGGR